ncbi:MAG TPA: hypothetical protein V6C86_07200 [Oculatellaceae cyanobacterium]
MAGGHHDGFENHTPVDALKGMESPFSAFNMLHQAFSGGGRGPESGGGMGDSFDPAKAQAALDKGMLENIYKNVMT